MNWPNSPRLGPGRPVQGSVRRAWLSGSRWRNLVGDLLGATEHLAIFVHHPLRHEPRTNSPYLSSVPSVSPPDRPREHTSLNRTRPLDLLSLLFKVHAQFFVLCRLGVLCPESQRAHCIRRPLPPDSDTSLDSFGLFARY